MDALEVVVGVLLKEVAVVVVAVGVDLLDESVFLAHLHLHSDPFAWQAPCIHHAEAAGLEADLELVAEAVGLEAGLELVAEAVGLEAGLELVVELAVWDVVDQNVVEAIFEVVAAKGVVEFEAADEELDLVAAAESEHFLFHETTVGVVGDVAVVEVLVLGPPVDDVG